MQKGLTKGFTRGMVHQERITSELTRAWVGAAVAGHRDLILGLVARYRLTSVYATRQVFFRLVPSGIGQFAVIQSVAGSFGVDVIPIGTREASEIEGGIAKLARHFAATPVGHEVRATTR